MFLQILGVVAVAVSIIPWILIPVLPLLLFFLYLRRYFLRTSRNIKRLESTSECPPVRARLMCAAQPDRDNKLFSAVLSPQLGVRSSPTCPRLSRACGRSEPLGQRRGSRTPSTPIRTCTRVSLCVF